MQTAALNVFLGTVGFMLLDAAWLGVVMKRFYQVQMAPIARLSETGGFAPNWPAAFVVYVLLGAGIATQAIPRASDLTSAAGYGALFGFLVYGVYDFTNFSTLRQWPFVLTLVDTAWGTLAGALCAAAVWAIRR